MSDEKKMNKGDRLTIGIAIATLIVIIGATFGNSYLDHRSEEREVDQATCEYVSAITGGDDEDC